MELGEADDFVFLKEKTLKKKDGAVRDINQRFDRQKKVL